VLLVLQRSVRPFDPGTLRSARDTDGSGVAAIYWKDTDSIAAFSRDPEHLAKKKSREIWYSHHMIRICKVERQYGRSD
jgi:heme-degrading monooxygenase HmoA